MWNVKTIAGLALAFCGVVALLAYLSWPKPTDPVTPIAEQATQLPDPIPAPTITIPEAPGKPALIAKPKTPEARKRTKLPPAIFDQPETYLMAVGALQSEDDRSYTISSVLDRRTGETTVHAVADPLPWFDFRTKGNAGVYYGIKDGNAVLRGVVNQEAFRIKRITAGAHATLDSDGEYFIGIGAQYKW